MIFGKPIKECEKCYCDTANFQEFPTLAGSPVICDRCFYEALTGEERRWARPEDEPIQSAGETINLNDKEA